LVAGVTFTLYERKPKRRPPTDGSALLAFQLAAVPIRGCVLQHRWHPVRKWRFDLAWPERKLAVEVDGGLYIRGAHSRGADREADMEKDAEAMCLGWRVLRVSPRHVKDLRALQWIERILMFSDFPGAK
jgi:very-short-patch-repair endonuclease